MPDALQADSPPLSPDEMEDINDFYDDPGVTKLASLRNCLRNCMMPDAEIKVGRQIQETIQES